MKPIQLLVAILSSAACSSTTAVNQNQPDSAAASCDFTGQYLVHYVATTDASAFVPLDDKVFSLVDADSGVIPCAVDAPPTSVDSSSCSVAYDCSEDFGIIDSDAGTISEDMIPISGTVSFTNGGTRGVGNVTASATAHQSGCTWTVTYTKKE